MGLIYVDSCLVIYLVERHPAWVFPLRRRLAEHADESFAISPLVRLECLAGPLRDGDHLLVETYRSAFAQFAEVPILPLAFDIAAGLRATHRIKTPDALHLATARLAGCARLWTNDSRLAAAAPGFAIGLGPT